jgi:hypothetical protein
MTEAGLFGLLQVEARIFSNYAVSNFFNFTRLMFSYCIYKTAAAKLIITAVVALHKNRNIFFALL